jgi:hypothetical protein
MQRMADMDEKDFVNEVYRRLQILLQKVKAAYDADSNYMYDSLEEWACETELKYLWREFKKPHNLYNLIKILLWLNATNRYGDLKNNDDMDCAMETYRKVSDLTPQDVSNLIEIARNLNPAVESVISEQKNAHSMFRTLVVKFQ